MYWAIVWLTTGQSVRAFNGVISTSSVISYFSLFLSNPPKNGKKQFWRLRLYSKYSRRPIFINLKNTFFICSCVKNNKKSEKWATQLNGTPFSQHFLAFVWTFKKFEIKFAAQWNFVNSHTADLLTTGWLFRIGSELR